MHMLKWPLFFVVESLHTLKHLQLLHRYFQCAPMQLTQLYRVREKFRIICNILWKCVNAVLFPFVKCGDTVCPVSTKFSFFRRMFACVFVEIVTYCVREDGNSCQHCNYLLHPLYVAFFLNFLKDLASQSEHSTVGPCHSLWQVCSPCPADIISCDTT